MKFSSDRARRLTAIALSFAAAATVSSAFGAPMEPVFSLAQKEKPALLDMLKDLVSIESGSKDIEGLDKIAAGAGRQGRTGRSKQGRLPHAGHARENRQDGGGAL